MFSYVLVLSTSTTALESNAVILSPKTKKAIITASKHINDEEQKFVIVMKFCPSSAEK